VRDAEEERRTAKVRRVVRVERELDVLGEELGDGRLAHALVHAQAHVRQRAQREERLARGELVEERVVVGGVHAVVDPVDPEVEHGLAHPRRRALLARVHRQPREADFARRLVHRGKLGRCRRRARSEVRRASNEAGRKRGSCTHEGCPSPTSRRRAQSRPRSRRTAASRRQPAAPTRRSGA